MQNKAHNFPPYHIGNAPRRKLRGVSFFASRIFFCFAKDLCGSPNIGKRRAPALAGARRMTEGVRRAFAKLQTPAAHISLARVIENDLGI